ncbi:7310_t:CDS:2 [Gigaspora margarita]|uniref:7310_t:CDS:1 n=1 Tax=Gigaspora margarita TaxID=4874 RepID=A0ABN7V1X0_GIGMA|nr:7310_t:CDS:2 [Gigaspora margarita]
MSEILIFGLQLESVKKACNAKNRELKSIENCSDFMILKQAKNFENQAFELLKSALQNYYSKKDCINMKAIDYSVNNYNFYIDFEKKDLIKTKQHQLAVVQALDKTQVLQEGYRQIAAVNFTIPREEVEKNSMDADEYEMIDIAKIGAQHSIKDLLNYIIPYLEQSNILKCTDPFWKNYESHNWSYTSIMGNDKLKVLQSFNFGVLFRPSRAKLIYQLWNQFYFLYQAFRNQKTDPFKFKKDALSWLNLFLTPSQGISTNPNNAIDSLYLPSQVISYIHIFVYHG